MDKEIIDKRKKIFWEELNKLREEDYLSSKVLRQVSAAYREYYLDKEKVWGQSHQPSDSLAYEPDETELKPEPKPAETKPVKSIKEKKTPRGDTRKKYYLVLEYWGNLFTDRWIVCSY